MFNSLKADCDHNTSLPETPPGAKFSIETFSYLITSVPGIFFEALTIPKSSFIMINIPFLFLYLRPLTLPFPLLIFLLIFILSNSSLTSAEPNCDNPGSGDLDYCIEKINQEINALKPAHEYNKQELANLRTEINSLNKQINGITAQLNIVENNIGQREEDLAFAQEIFEAKANSHYKFLCILQNK